MRYGGMGRPFGFDYNSKIRYSILRSLGLGYTIIHAHTDEVRQHSSSHVESRIKRVYEQNAWASRGHYRRLLVAVRSVTMRVVSFNCVHKVKNFKHWWSTISISSMPCVSTTVCTANKNWPIILYYISQMNVVSLSLSRSCSNSLSLSIKHQSPLPIQRERISHAVVVCSTFHLASFSMNWPNDRSVDFTKSHMLIQPLWGLRSQLQPHICSAIARSDEWMS